MDLWNAVQGMMTDYYATFGELSVARNDAKKSLGEIMEKASSDHKFREKLIASPVKVLAQNGFQLPEGFSVKFIEETEDTLFLPIPPFAGTADKGGDA